MELTHRFTVPAPIDEAWAAFNDLERIAPCFPGAALTSYDGEQFDGLVKVKLGPISLQYTGTGRFVERDEAGHRAVIEAKGRDKRGNGTAAASVTAELQSVSKAETGVTVVTDLAITGKPAQFGRGVMQDVSDKLLAQFSSCLETKLSGPDDASGGEPSDDEASGDEATAEASGATAEAASSAEPDRSTPDSSTPDSSTPDSSTPDSSTPDSSTSTGPPAAALDLGATVLPVLLKRYAVQLAGALVVLLVLKRLLGRRHK